MEDCFDAFEGLGITSSEQNVGSRKSFLDNYECRNEVEEELVGQIRHFRCPFTWEASGHKAEPADNTADKSFTISMIRYCHQLQEGCLYASNKEYEESLKLLQSAEVISNQPNLTRTQKGLKYVINCSRAFVFLLKEDYDKVRELLKIIPPYEDLGANDKAAVMGTYGGIVFCNSCILNLEKSVEVFEECIKLDPHCFFWYFKLGRSLLKIHPKRNRTGMVDDAQVNAFRKSFELSRDDDAYPMVYFARCLREKARALYFNKISRSECDSLNKEARELYDRALATVSATGNTYLLIGICEGFMKLPWPYKNNSGAENCLTRAFEIDPENTATCLKAAIFHENVKRDYKMALHYLQKSKVAAFVVELKTVILQSLVDKSFDPIPQLTESCDKLSRMSNTESKQMPLLLLRGCFYSLKFNKMNAAIQDWLKAAKMRPGSFEGEFKVTLNFRCFMEDASMRQKIQTLPEALKDKIKYESEESKKQVYRRIILILEDVIEEKLRTEQDGGRNQTRGRRMY